MGKTFDELTIADDFMFSKVMLNKKLAKHFLEVILDCKIQSISYPIYEHFIDIRYDAKSVRLDVILEDDTHTVYNLEMQTTTQPGLTKRSRYYQDLIDLDLLQKGANYNELNHCLVIFICTFDLFEKDQYIYRFRNVCRELPELELEDGTEKVFVNTTGHLGTVTEEFKQVMRMFNGLIAEGNFVEELQQEVDRVKLSKDWRREYMKLHVLLDDTKREGIIQGELLALTKQVCRKLQKQKTPQEIAEDLDESLEKIQQICNIAKEYAPDYDPEAICAQLLSNMQR